MFAQSVYMWHVSFFFQAVRSLLERMLSSLSSRVFKVRRPLTFIGLDSFLRRHLFRSAFATAFFASACSAS